MAISRIRACNHRLPIEDGRHKRISVPREQRICTKCDSGLLGDEFHFILICTNPVLLELREKYISPFYTLSPSMAGLIELFSNKGKKLFKLARYIYEGLEIYWNNHISYACKYINIVLCNLTDEYTFAQNTLYEK